MLWAPAATGASIDFFDYKTIFNMPPFRVIFVAIIAFTALIYRSDIGGYTYELSLKIPHGHIVVKVGVVLIIALLLGVMISAGKSSGNSEPDHETIDDGG